MTSPSTRTGYLTCPADVTQPMSKRTRTVSFSAACTGCPLRERCTTAATIEHNSLSPRELMLAPVVGSARVVFAGGKILRALGFAIAVAGSEKAEGGDAGQ